MLHGVRTSFRTAASRTVLRATSVTSRYVSGHSSLLQTRVVAPSSSRRYTTAPPRQPAVCPSCSTPLPSALPACPRCSFIAPLPPWTTYYDVLGLSPDANKFDVDPVDLKQKFRQLQNLIHPDKWSRRGPDAQSLAAHMSSLVNKAYTTLLNPFSRAEYILNLEGLAIDETDNLDDPEMIMEVMEAREGLDSAASQEEVDAIRNETMDKIAIILPQIMSSVSAKDWPTVKRNAIKLKYLQGIDAAAEAWPNRVHDH